MPGCALPTAAATLSASVEARDTLLGPPLHLTARYLWSNPKARANPQTRPYILFFATLAALSTALAAAVFVAYFAALAAAALEALDAAFQAWQTCARGWAGRRVIIQYFLAVERCGRRIWDG